MSGHSKWHTIKHKKGAADAKRGKVFTRIIKELTVAARNGGGDPDMQSRACARSSPRPSRSTCRPTTSSARSSAAPASCPASTYEEITYEGYGPGGAALIIEVLTDNKNRTVGELRHLLDEVRRQPRRGEQRRLDVRQEGLHRRRQERRPSEETLLAAALDAGADDLRDDGDNWEVVSPPDAFQQVLDAIKALGIEPAAAEIAMLPQNYVKLEGKPAQQMVKLMEVARGARRHQEGLVERRHRGKGDRGLVGVRIFGIDPGSRRTGYGCVERIGSRHRLVVCGSLSGPPRATFPDKLHAIHAGLAALLATHRPDCVAIEDIFHARNVAQRAEARARARRRAARRVGGGRAGRRVRAGRDQARRRRLRPRREAPGAADGQAAARPRRARRRRTTSPTRWRWRSVTSHAHRQPGAGAVASAARRGGLPAVMSAQVRLSRHSLQGSPTLVGPAAGLATLGPRDSHDCLLRGTLLEKHPSRVVVDVAGVGYDVQVPLSTFYGLGEPGASVVAADSHARAGRCARALRVSARRSSRISSSGSSPISGIGPKLALAVLSGIEPADLIRADPHAGRGAADGHSRRRQEDGRADRARAEGPAAARPCRRADPAAGCRASAGSACATISLSALRESGLPARRRPRRRSTQRSRRPMPEIASRVRSTRCAPSLRSMMKGA